MKTHGKEKANPSLSGCGDRAHGLIDSIRTGESSVLGRRDRVYSRRCFALSNQPDNELDSLRQEIAHLQSRVAQMREIGDAYEQAEENERVSAQKIDDMQRLLKRALESQRRQMGEISRIISRFLPHNFPVIRELAIAANCRPCADVGGDYYDVVQMEDGRVALLMADIAGHGASAAVAMATTRALFRAALLEASREIGPSLIMQKLSQWFQNQLEPEQFVTMWLGIWDDESSTLRVASAAHPPAVIWRMNQDPKYLEVDNGLPVGLAGIDPMEYSESELKLNPGDQVFLYTDGWIESASRSGEFLDGQKFLEFLENAYGQPVSQIPTVLFMEFERHAAGSRIRDDVSLLVFSRVDSKGGQPSTAQMPKFAESPIKPSEP